MTYCEEAAVAALMVDCGDVHDPLAALREERLQALIVALEPVAGVAFVVRDVWEVLGDDDPPRHWAVRLARDPTRRARAPGEQAPLAVMGVPFAPPPSAAWWTTSEITEAKRRGLIRPVPGIKKTYELGASVRKARAKGAK